MKNVIVKYDKYGKLEDITNKFLLFEQENNSLSVSAYISTSKKVRAYIKAENNNSYVTDEILPADEVYNLTIGDEYMVGGTLYVGYELYDDTGYTERLEPVKLYVDSFVSLGTTRKNNVYVVSMKIGDVVTLEADEQAIVENVGTKKDMVLNFGIPRGVQGLKGEKGDKGDKGEQGIQGEPGYIPVKGKDYFTPEEKAELLDETQKEVLEDVDKRIKYINYISDEYATEDEWGDIVYPTEPNYDEFTEEGIYHITCGTYEWMEKDTPRTILLLVDRDGSDVLQTKIENGRFYRRDNWDYDENGEIWSEWEETYKTKSTILTYPSSDTLYLAHNKEARLGERSSLVLTTPSIIDERYESYFTFISGETPTTLTYSSTPIRWSGDDVDYDGIFVPEADKIYEVAIKYLGNDRENKPIISARVGVV